MKRDLGKKILTAFAGLIKGIYVGLVMTHLLTTAYYRIPRPDFEFKDLFVRLGIVVIWILVWFAYLILSFATRRLYILIPIIAQISDFIIEKILLSKRTKLN